MKKWRLLIVLGVVAAAGLYGLSRYLQSSPAPAPLVPTRSATGVPPAPTASPQWVTPAPAQPGGPASMPNVPTSPLARHEGIPVVAPAVVLSAGHTPSGALDSARLAIRDYRLTFGGNPVGTNPEITAALEGHNPKGAKFLRPEAEMRVNAIGELVDPWDSPYFFHQLSGTEMEIRSAGPDRIMWTSDDIVAR